MLSALFASLVAMSDVTTVYRNLPEVAAQVWQRVDCYGAGEGLAIMNPKP